MANYLISDDKCLIKAGGAIFDDLGFGTLPLFTIVSRMPDGISSFPLGDCTASIFPQNLIENIPDDLAIVTIKKFTNIKEDASMFAVVTYENDDGAWICTVETVEGTTTTSAWKQITMTAANNG